MTDKSWRILIVDDEPDLLDVIADQIEFSDHEAIKAGSVQEALVILDTNTIDFVVSDIRMPKSTGLDLLEQANVPVVLMSGYADILADQAIEKGALGLVAKPFPIESLLEIFEGHKTKR